MRGHAPADRRLHLRAGARARASRADHRRRRAAADRAAASSAWPTRRPRCWCRWSTAARRSACWPRLTAARRASVFSEDDEQLLRTFAASAATAVALAQSVQADRLRSSLAAADAERRRWARELHDETLQGLGGLRLLLSSAPRRGDDLERSAGGDGRGRRAHRAGDREPARDHHRAAPRGAGRAGLRTAIEALLDRHREQSGFEIDGELAAARPPTAGGAPRARISRPPSTGSCRRRSRTSPSTRSASTRAGRGHARPTSELSDRGAGRRRRLSIGAPERGLRARGDARARPTGSGRPTDQLQARAGTLVGRDFRRSAARQAAGDDLERRGARIEMERPEQSRPTEETADARTPSSPRRTRRTSSARLVRPSRDDRAR